MRYETIKDCWHALLEMGGGIENLLDIEELRDIIHAEGLTYREVTKPFLSTVWYAYASGGEYEIGSWSHYKEEN